MVEGIGEGVGKIVCLPESKYLHQRLLPTIHQFSESEQ